jgi:UDP-glucose 4-epimerase
MESNPSSTNNNLTQAPAWRKIMRFYRYLKPGIWAMRLPWIGSWLQRVWIPEDGDANWFIPVNEEIPTGEQMILSGQVVERLIQEAALIFAMAACPCRMAFQCRQHTWGIGCLHLGTAASQIPGDVGHLLETEEALTHLHRALESGLIPTILHMPSEAEIFGVDQSRMLSICFCCECCCDVRLLLKEGPDRYWDEYNHRLPGVEVVVDENCTLCGSCVEVCYGGERVIQMGAERAEIGARCIGCGVCIPACTEEAIGMRFDPQLDVVEALLAKVSERVQIGL